MKKRYLKTALAVLGLGLVCLMGYKIYTKIEYKSSVAKQMKTLPEFSFETMDDKEFSNNDIQKNKAIVFIYFNSECMYCQLEIESIQSNIEEFKEAQLLFVSEESKEAIQAFAQEYQLNTYDYVTFLSDKEEDFSTHFGATSVPYILIYSPDQKLIKKNKGILKVDHILEAI